MGKKSRKKLKKIGLWKMKREKQTRGTKKTTQPGKRGTKE